MMKLKSYSTRSTTGFSVSTTVFFVSTAGFSVSCEDGACAEASAGEVVVVDATTIVVVVAGATEVDEAEAVGGLNHATGPSL